MAGLFFFKSLSPIETHVFSVRINIILFIPNVVVLSKNQCAHLCAFAHALVATVVPILTQFDERVLAHPVQNLKSHASLAPPHRWGLSDNRL
jgi:hypothetical protein